MRNSDQEKQDVPIEQVNKVRMALVEPASSIGTIPCQTTIGENRQIKWWALAFPVVVITVIIAAHLLNIPVIVSAEGDKSLLDEPALLAASTTSKRSPAKSAKSGVVSGIAHSENGAIAFVNDEMVSEGDVVDGITVFKIHRDAVEFEKSGKRWKQKVGE
jgi:hypothetical protein